MKKRHNMAVVKASYTRTTGAGKASVRYAQCRAGKEGAKITRELFGFDGRMTREEALEMIDRAKEGTYFYRFIINLDQQKEDTYRDINLQEIAKRTMEKVEKIIKHEVQWVASIHDDHTPLRHLHIVAPVFRHLQEKHLYEIRKGATRIIDLQRKELDETRQPEKQKGQEWERER